MAEPRPYQADALGAALKALERVRSVLLVLATGLGKTALFSYIAKHFAKTGRVLILEPRRHLVEQAEEEVKAWAKLTTGIEMGRLRCDPRKLPEAVIASVSSMARPKRLATYDPGTFALVVIDECHHAVSATYQRVLEHFVTAKRVGVTATPDRHDRQSLAQIFDEAPFRFDIDAGIRTGFLVPIRQRKVVVTAIDYSRVRATRTDLNRQDLERVLTEESHLQGVAGALLEHAGTRPTLVFTVSRAHAQRLAAVINRMREKSARAIDGRAKDKDRKTLLAEFRAREFQFLINCDLFREGFNAEWIECVAFDRPTRSRIAFAQMLGRGTRLSPATGKVDLLILDFAGNTTRHRLITALDVLAGDLEPRIREAAEFAAAQGVDLLAAVEAAQAEAAREAARLREITEEQRRNIVAEVRSHLVVVPTDLSPSPPPPLPPTQPVQIDALPPPPPPRLPTLDCTGATALGLPRPRRPSHAMPDAVQASLLRDHDIDPATQSARGARDLLAAFALWKRKSQLPPPRPKGRR